MAFPSIKDTLQSAMQEHRTFPDILALLQSLTPLCNFLLRKENTDTTIYLGIAPWLPTHTPNTILQEITNLPNSIQQKAITYLNSKNKNKRINCNDINTIIKIAINLIIMQSFGFTFVRAIESNQQIQQLIRVIIQDTIYNKLNTKSLIETFIVNNSTLTIQQLNTINDNTIYGTQSDRRLNSIYSKHFNAFIGTLDTNLDINANYLNENTVYLNNNNNNENTNSLENAIDTNNNNKSFLFGISNSNNEQIPNQSANSLNKINLKDRIYNALL